MVDASRVEQASGARSAPESWETLGAIRFWLASIVLCGHLFRFIPAAGIFNRALLLFGKLDPVAAVIGFLVISGFSIAHSIEQNPEGYYRRRLIRVYPLYCIGLLAVVTVHVLLGPDVKVLEGDFVAPDAPSLAGHLLFLQGFVVHPVEADRPLWTLAVEVFCYLLAPLLISLRLRTQMAMAGVSLIAYMIFPHLHLDFYSRLLFGLPTLFLSWAWIGGFILYRAPMRNEAGVALILAGALALSVNNIALTKYAVFTYVLTVVILMFSRRWRIHGRWASIASYLGELSYPLYIFHLPLLILGYALLGLRDGLSLGALAAGGAVMAYHLVDAPIRRRFRARSSRSATIPAKGGS